MDADITGAGVGISFVDTLFMDKIRVDIIVDPVFHVFVTDRLQVLGLAIAHICIIQIFRIHHIVRIFCVAHLLLPKRGE